MKRIHITIIVTVVFIGLMSIRPGSVVGSIIGDFFHEDAKLNQLCPTENCRNRLVTMEDSNHEGTFREILSQACKDLGDDAIAFEFTDVIELENPIVIPKNCNGRIFIYGLPKQRNAVSGKDVDAPDDGGPNCLIKVESDDNVIQRLNVIDYSNSDPKKREQNPGVAICLFGNKNKVIDSSFGVIDTGSEPHSNDVGVLIRGDENEITNSHFSQNKLDGIQIEGNKNKILSNYLGLPVHNCDFGKEVPSVSSPLTGDNAATEDNNAAASENSPSGGGCELVPAGDTSCPLVSNWRHGIHLMGDAHDNVVGGEGKDETNILQFNGYAGIRLSGSYLSVGNLLSPNVFNQNKFLGIDLGTEGANPNDEDDSDVGPNTLLNKPELNLVHVRMFYKDDSQPMIKLYGSAPIGSTVHVYIADDPENKFPEGIGRIVTATVPADKNLFSVEIPSDAKIGMGLIVLAVDAENNTSEFSEVKIIERDTDMDGIPDLKEETNGNGIKDNDESDVYDQDTDGDGLPGGVEDANHNGKKDTNETAAYLPDTDFDELSDFIETHGDGVYNPEVGDTDPLKYDTDCDGLSDGEEDANHNGIVEWSEGETFPQLWDSDGDGVSDGPLKDCVAGAPEDNCLFVSNPDQLDSDGDKAGDACDFSVAR